MSTIKAGVYQFNETLNSWTVQPSLENMAFETSVNSYVSLYITASSLQYKTANTSINVYLFANNNWYNDKQRTIILYEDQTVSTSFYNWFTFNAVNVPLKVKAGMYRFDNIVRLPDDASCYIDFKSNGSDYNRMVINNSMIIYSSPVTVVYSAKKNWVDIKYQTIQVDVEQTVELKFYSWAIVKENLEVVDTSQLEIVLYQNTAEKVRVDKTKYLKTIAKIQGTLRDVTSLTHLVLTIEYPLPNFNYAYIAMFNRYYFVSGIKSVKYGLWEVSMSVDVLMTYKEALNNCYAMINRNEYDFNQFIIDNQIPFQQGQEVTIYEIVDNKLFDSNNGSYVLQGLLVAPGDKI